MVPAEIMGVYVNIETSVTKNSTGGFTNTQVAASFPGWDIHTYGSSNTSFYWSYSSFGPSAGVRFNTVAGGTTNGNATASLLVGFTIGSHIIGGTTGASFGTGSAGFTTFNQGKCNLSTTNYFGFRFAAKETDDRCHILSHFTSYLE
jgi:hypothetical protein